MDALETFDHPAWVTAGATLISYGLILLVLSVLLFLIPYLAVSQGLV
jgi:hypothetical protein